MPAEHKQTARLFPCFEMTQHRGVVAAGRTHAAAALGQHCLEQQATQLLNRPFLSGYAAPH
jgi:hypothetical protein